MEIIDLSQNNCWIVKLMPFSDEKKGDNDFINKYQKICIENTFFGMGWRDKDASQEKAEEQNLSKSGVNCLNKYYKEIQVGDFVITRLRNGKVYIGIVKDHIDNNPLFFVTNEDVGEEFPSPSSSYGCNVEEWYECGHEIIASEIQGRLSQRRQSTIKRVANSRQQILIRAMYEHASHTDGPYSSYRVKYNINNFARCLDYMELEDLVSFHILQQKENEGYLLQPSSCKISTLKYEFMFIHSQRRPITCQVKNQAEIYPDAYYDDSTYERIYLFSGLWDDAAAEKLQAEVAKKSANIVIIRPSDLFNTLKANSELFINCYYENTETPNAEILVDILENANFSKHTCRKSWSDGLYEKWARKKNDDGNGNGSHEEDDATKVDDIVFNYGIFYSSDFENIVIPHRNYENISVVKDLAVKVCNTLNLSLKTI